LALLFSWKISKYIYLNSMKNLILLNLFWLLSSLAHAATVQQFQPQGPISDQRRVTVRFSEDMTKLGATTAAAPFQLDCQGIKGEGRWVDSATWAWQMERSLEPGERCIFTIKAETKSLSGDNIDGKTRFEFVGASPRPWRVTPSSNSTIEEDQAFILDAGVRLDAKSLENNLWCEAEGVGQRMPARAVSEDIRRQVLKQRSAGTNALVVSCSERLPACRRASQIGLG
jgi:alpha-2-macroglobulin